MMKMKHVVMFSGGVGSFCTAQRVIEEFGRDNTYLLFTDTLIEDADLYRFMLEAYGVLFGTPLPLEHLDGLPPVTHEDMQSRKNFLIALGKKITATYPHFIWLSDGRDPWNVFKDVRYLGNSRLAQCSHKLKQEVSKRYIHENFHPDETIIYLGIDWNETHRMKAPRENWKPYTVEFPMTEKPYLDKSDMISMLEDVGIRQPELYAKGFSHNNCGGFCVRAGQGHFVNLLKTSPDLFRYHEEKEKEMREYLGKDVSILRKQINNQKVVYTLTDLRRDHEVDESVIDMLDIGGCGCFVDD